MKRCLFVMAGAALACSAAWAGPKQFNVVIPTDMEEWVAAVPMISLDSGKTAVPMRADPNRCGWFSYTFADGPVSDNVFLLRDDDVDREDMLGMNGNWETAASPTPIPLGMVFELYQSDTLYFVPDEAQKTNESGWYENGSLVDGIEGVCSYVVSTIIYDSDANLHPAFSCYSAGGEGCQLGAQDVAAKDALAAVNNCIGVTPGVVETTLDPTTKKTKLSAEGKKCFIDEKYFNQLFNYTENVNEKTCYDLPLSRTENGWWSFNSDFFTSPNTKTQGGYFPVEGKVDEGTLRADPNQTPLAVARTLYDAEGPVFYGPSLRKLDSLEGVPVFDLLCKGPGWSKGRDCSGQFDNGATTEEFVQAALKLPTTRPDNCVLGWGCPEDAPEGWQFYEEGTETPIQGAYVPASGNSYRWTGKRNHHFCQETHTKFIQKPGLRFNARGSDDIWVFIDNKLAIDLGGVHLDAPGYVDLDEFEGASGKLVTGEQYDLDIFFCDRRTTMSNLQIRTNIFMAEMEKSAISTKAKRNTSNPSETEYCMCYAKTGGGDCSSAIAGAAEKSYCCNDPEMTTLPISYTLVIGSNSNGTAVDGFDKISTPGVYKGGIDLTNIASPKVDLSKMALPGGRYTLFVTIEGKTKKVASFRIGTDAIKPVAHIAGVSFTVKNNLPQALTITATKSAAKYAVMDLQGRVVRQGVTAGAETVVPNLKPGSYIVKVARETRRVNVR